MSTRKNVIQRLSAMTIAATGMIIANNANGQELFNNGGLSTGPTTNSGVAAPAGTNWSEVQADAGNTTQANTSAGFGASIDASGTGNPTGGLRLSDNFVVPPGQLWNITGVSVFSYQTGQGTTASPIDRAHLQIWRGRPDLLGSTVVFGDMTTNRLGTQADASLFRVFNTTTPAPGTVPGTTRHIWRSNLNAVTSLPPGDYWIDYQVSTLNNATAFHPAVTIVGDRGLPSWNAVQFLGPQATPFWAAVIDAGNPAAAPDLPQDLPFIVTGTQGNGCSVPLPACPADIAPIGGNGAVNVDDLLGVINTWGQTQVPPGSGPRPTGDTAPLPNGNCLVNVDDLLAVINAWGNCPAPTGACCLPNGTCQVLTEAACLAAAGNTVWAGPGVACGAFCPVRPANDLCAAAAVAVNGANPFNNLNALNDGPAGAPGNACESGVNRDVWFNYTATATGAVEFNTVGSTGATDTILAVYNTTACPVTTLLGCNDDIDGANNRLSRLIVNLTNGQQVKVRVGTFGLTQMGAGVLNISFVGNDICLGAQAVAVPSVTNGFLGNAGQDTAPTCNSVAAGLGVWYTVTGNGNTLTANTCASPTEFWADAISVYCGSSCTDLNCIVSASVGTCGPLGFNNTVSWCSAAGQTYWILVHTATSPSPGEGNFVLTVTNGASCNNPIPCSCFSCDAGSQNEGEACVTAIPDTINGGCNSTPPVFSTLTFTGNVAKVCGQSSTFLNGTTQSRDTDWYVFTVAASGSYTVSVDRARFTCLSGIVTNAGAGNVPPSNILLCATAPQGAPAFVLNSTVTTTGLNCAGAALAAPVTLPPGTYALFVGASVFTGFPCGSSLNDYQVSLTRSNP